MEVKGLDEIQSRLSGLSAYAERDVVKNALKKAANVVATAARELVPEKTGALKRAIRVRMGRAKAKGSISVIAAVGRQWFVGDQFYGAFQEFGWRAGKRKGAREQDTRKQIPGEHFMQYAFDETAAQAMAALKSELIAGIEREATK